VVRVPVVAGVPPDPVSRFPFRVTDPQAVPVPRPEAFATSGLEPSVEHVMPGPELARVFTEIDPADVTDLGLVELAAAAVRLESWSHAVAARYAGLLAQRESMNPAWSTVAGVPRVADVAGDELALRLSWSRRAAQRLVRHGRAFDRGMVDTGDALARGRLDPVRAGIVADRLDAVALPVAWGVQDRVLEGVERRTAAQVRADVERALLAVDPGEAAARVRHARSGRRVDRPRVLPDGMAGWWAVLPASEATRMDRVLDAAARGARAAGDSRTLDQLRADGLCDLVLHTSCAAEPLTGPATETRTGTSPLARTEIPTGARAATSPGARAATSPGARADAVAVAATDPELDRDDPSAAREDTGRVHGRRVRPVAQIRVTVPLSTLLGGSEPGDLAGYGPIDPVTARALAAGGVWRRLVTDPLSGAVLDLGRTRYRPGVELAEHVVARDRTCVRPGCSADAQSCDLDHTREFHPRPGEPGPGGDTAAANLGPLCRRDHRLKTDGGHHLRQTAPGRYEWVTPTGKTYTSQPGIDPPSPRSRDIDPPDADPRDADLRGTDPPDADPRNADLRGTDPRAADQPGADPPEPADPPPF
jgi:hypothetical protein